MITVRFGKQLATVADGAWQSDDAELLARLNAINYDRYAIDGYVPSIDVKMARVAAKRLQGEIVRNETVQRELEPGMVY